MIADPERLRRLRRLRERVADHPELYRQVCARIVLAECGADRPFLGPGGNPNGGGRQKPRLPTADDSWASFNQ